MSRLLWCMMVMWVASAAVAQDATSRNEADRGAISASIDAYVAAFNRGDAKALTELWTPGGELVLETGERVQGSASIQKHFAEYFAGTKGVKLELVEPKIEFQSPSVAVEKGVARVISPDSGVESTTYTAVHIKTANGWRIDSTKDQVEQPSAPSHYEHLEPLSWLVGKWTDAGHSGRVQVNCRWARNNNFLTQSFKVMGENDVEFEGSMVIGWDPSVKAIRSWMFDSDGGFGTGVWSQEETRWTIRTLNVLPDGRRGASTNVYEVLDGGSVQFKSIGRVVDGELMPSVGPVKLVRDSE
ncbi:MAG: YybH family protein [Pirellula sp.]|jgi:uncharacterized protein (TIGR02246 family)